MTESVKELIPTGKIRRPSYETVVNWIDVLGQWHILPNII